MRRAEITATLPIVFGLDRLQAAASVGISATTFDALVSQRLMPTPRLIEQERVWDVDELYCARLSIDRERAETEKTCLYRHFDKAGTLLYVGIARDHQSRLKAHSRYAEWRYSIATVTVEYFDTREDAAKAEVKAIKTESPLHNITHQLRDYSGRCANE